MAQDIISDALNNILNVRRLEKKELRIKKVSKVLVRLLTMMKEDGYLDFEIVDGKKPEAIVKIIKLNECRAIKPRYSVGVSELDKYIRRFLPSRNFGTLVVSTNQGLVRQKDVYDKNTGGCLLAYYY
jgi:small subunit ribosomal protein S8